MKAKKAKSSGFIPGPWTAEDESMNSITIRAASNSTHKLGREIASVMNEEAFNLTPTMWADAKLIAAAPKLYEAAMVGLVYLQAQDLSERGKTVAQGLIDALALAAD